MIQEVVKSGDIGWGIYRFYFPCEIIGMYRSGTDISIRLKQDVLKLYEGTKGQVSNRYTAQADMLRKYGVPEHLCHVHKVYKDSTRECTIILPDFIVEQEGLKIGSKYHGFIDKIEHKEKFFSAATQVLYLQGDVDKCYITVNFNELTNDVVIRLDDEVLSMNFEFDNGEGLQDYIFFKDEKDLVKLFKFIREQNPNFQSYRLDWILSNNIEILKNYYPEYVWRSSLEELSKEEEVHKEEELVAN